MKKEAVKEDRWVYTQCHRCQSECGIKAHVVDGVCIKLEGIEESCVGSHGGMCPRGMAGLQVLYDPNRLKYPLKRTNPKKGIGQDPKWERISWDEALDTISSKMKEAYDKNPERIIVQHGIVAGNQIIPYFFVPMMFMLSNEKGSPLHINAAGSMCGNAGHYFNSTQYGAFCICPDFDYCNYLLVFGTNASNGGFQQWATLNNAKARRRGMKMVVFDPMFNAAAAKADEWIPLVPGTDGLVALSLIEVIVNELGMYDVEYIKTRTNGSYLINKETGEYVRDEETNKPYIWDAKEGKAKVYDDPSIKEFILEGEYEVDGIKCVPSWLLMEKHFEQYTPEATEATTGVPAETIRRIAKEYAEAACIGQTINIDGEELPYRPVTTYNIRSAGTHSNGFHTLFAIDLLIHIMGAANMPGGTVSASVECEGHPETHRPYFACKAGKDGFTQTAGKWLFPQGGFWPIEDPKKPVHDMEEMFPTAMEMLWINATDREEVLKKTGLNSEFDVLINYATNAMMNATNPHIREKFYKEIPFVVDCDIYSNEFNEGFADILLPDACYLERDDWMGIQHSYHNIPPSVHEPWCFHTTHHVIEPQYERRDMAQTVIELADRMGMRHKINAYYNNELQLEGDLKLDPNKKIDWIDLCDRACRAHFGDKHNWEWFCEHGFISWPKKVREVYWRAYKKDVKTMLYFEFMIHAGQVTREIAKELDMEDFWDWNVYTPLPTWKACDAHNVDKDEYPLYGFSWADTFHSNSNNQEVAWIDEVSTRNPFSYYININANTAKKLGLKDGDYVEAETEQGYTTRGYIKTRQGIHPDCAGMMGQSGHWAKGMPMAKGKGVNFNSLIDFKVRGMDPLTATVDILVKLKLRKIEEGGKE
ncbi:MAG: hypothetical protein E7242_11605 [Lachnospiraceae bacterium]|nr:hypothetical protein [Lachnospiraceae bacterium]